MVVADKRDYISGYRKHYSAYKILKNSQGAEKSRKLLLTYSVECGLKYLLLDKWQENNPKEIIENKEDRRHPIITSHNLQTILKELGQAGTFKFAQFYTIHHDTQISSENYHQVCRYGIRIEDRDKEKENKYETELNKIAEWIREGI